jgi:hypothetical protein
MGITVSSMAGSSRLTSVAAVQAELGISSDASLLGDLVDRASAAIVSYCNRVFARATYVETLPGFGDLQLQLARTPIVSVSTVTDQNSQVYTDYSIEDREKGWLYRRLGWSWSVQAFPGLSAGGSFMDFGTPMPRQEEPHYSVSYIAGYVLPSQYVIGATTISAAAADNSFNDSANGFPTNLVAGDVVETSSFTNAGNNGRFIVTGTPTAAKIVVSATLTLEAAGSARTVKFRPHADCRRNLDDVEKACIEAVKTWYLRRKDDADVAEKQMGPARVRYNEGAEVAGHLPPSCVGLLTSWRRVA